MSRGERLLLVFVAFAALACSPTGTITAEGEGSPPPAQGDQLAISSPDDGTTVSLPSVTVSGLAPDGADVVRDVRLGRDDHVTATGGQWSMEVELDEGENLLIFRLGDDATTSSTLLIIYAPAGSPTPTGSQLPTATAEPEPTPEPGATSDTPAKALAVNVTKRTSSVARNQTASVTIKTTRGATCSIEVHYSSGPSTAEGLDNKKAGSAGTITWKWTVGGRTAIGTYPIYISCERGDREGTAETTFRVR